ncbi:sulfatase-like hydrolase/transferase [bacterium]|nr:sulfatase-like hydrolase/transferase [bacterium]
MLPVLKSWVLVTVVLLTFGCQFPRPHEPPVPPLNVILLTVDSVNVSHLSTYGYHRPTTPTLDWISDNGIRFEHVIASACWTTPALLSLFTGLYPEVHGVRARGDSLLPETDSVFDLFRRHGYRVPNIAYLTAIPNYANIGLGTNKPQLVGRRIKKGDELLNWLKSNPQGPFFVWYHYSYLHLPYNPDPEFNIFLAKKQKKHLKSKSVSTVMKSGVIPQGSQRFSGQEKKIIQALYDGQLRELDHFFRKLLDQMTASNLHQNTLLVITADHGEELFEHGFIGHASTSHQAKLYDELVRIPLLLYAPSRFEGGQSIDSPVGQVDIMPTVLDIVGIPKPDGIHGMSLYHALQGVQIRNDRPLYNESILAGYQSNSKQRSIVLRSRRTSDWKLICTQKHDQETCSLFDLKNDPSEQNDQSSQAVKTFLQQKKLLKQHIAALQMERLRLLARSNTRFLPEEIPKEVQLQLPQFLKPVKGNSKLTTDRCVTMKLSWTGDPKAVYVLQYRIGTGFHNLTGAIPVQGISKEFGPLPDNICELLPGWNPFRFRVAPYGLDDYWSDWIELRIEHK